MKSGIDPSKSNHRPSRVRKVWTQDRGVQVHVVGKQRYEFLNSLDLLWQLFLLVWQPKELLKSPGHVARNPVRDGNAMEKVEA